MGFISSLFNYVIPVENSVFNGNISGVNDVDGTDTTSTIASAVTLNVTTSNGLLKAILETVKNAIDNPSELTSSLKDILKNTFSTSNSATETISLDAKTTALLITSGLLYVDLESNGDYTIYSPLFNMLNESDSMNILLGYNVVDSQGAKASDSIVADVASITVVGTNDKPVAIDATQSNEIKSGEEFEGTLPGAYTKAMASTLIDAITDGGSSLSDLIDKDALIDTVKEKLLASVDLTVDESVITNLQSQFLPIILEDLGLSTFDMLSALPDIAPIVGILDDYQNFESTVKTGILSYLETQLPNDYDYSTNDAALDSAIASFKSTLKNGLFSNESITTGGATLIGQLNTLYGITITSLPTEVTTLVSGMSADITSFAPDLAEAIENILEVTVPVAPNATDYLNAVPATYPDNEAAFAAFNAANNAYTTANNAYTTAHDALLLDINNLIAEFIANPSTENLNTQAQALFTDAMTSFNISGTVDDVILNALPDDLKTALNNFKAALDIDTSAVLAKLDLNAILSNLGINLDFNTDAITADLKTALTEYVKTISLDDLADGPTAVAPIIDGLLDTVIEVINTTFDNILKGDSETTLTDAELIAAINSAVTAVVVSDLSTAITALGAALDETFNLENIDYQDLFSDIINQVMTDLTSGIQLHVADIKTNALDALFDQFGLDTDLLDETKRTEISSEIAQDVYARLSIDEDIADLATISYHLDNNVTITTKVLDENGVEVSGLDISAGTTVTVNADGTYTISNPTFATLNTLYKVEVSFDYYIKDNKTTSLAGSEDGQSESKTVTTTIDFVDTSSTGTVTDGYLANATVFADANENGVLDIGEASTTTDANGDFTLNGGVGPIVAYGGVDISTGLAFEGVMTAPAGSTVVTPVTTLINQVMENDDTLSATQAATLVASNLGLGVTGDALLAYDPTEVAANSESTAEEIATALEVQSISVQIINIMSQVAQAADYATNGATNEQQGALDTVEALASLVTDGGSIDLTSTSTIQTIVDGVETSIGETISDESDIVEATSNINNAISNAQTIEEIAQVQIVAETIEESIEDNGELENTPTTTEIETAAEGTSASTALTNPEVEESALKDIPTVNSTYEGLVAPIIDLDNPDSYALNGDGNIVISLNGSTTQDLISNVTVTVNTDGTYTVTSPDFVKLDTTDTLAISFDYKNNNSDASTVNLTITGTDTELVISGNDDLTVNEDAAVATGKISAIDYDDDITITYTSNAVDGFTLDENSGDYTFDASHASYQYLSAGQIQDIAITITLTDQNNQTSTTTLNIQVVGTNDAPTVSSITAVDTSTTVVTGTVNANDLDTNDTLTFSATTTAGFTLNTSTGAYSFDPTNEAYNYLAQGQQATVTIPVTVTDSEDQTATTNIVVNLTGTNDAPTVQSVQTLATNEGDSVISGNLNASDIDTDDELTYELNSAVDGFTLDENTGDYTFDPAHLTYNALSTGETLTVIIPITVSDKLGTQTTTQLEVTLTGTNDAPTVTSIAPVTLNEGSTALIGTVQAQDDDSSLTYSVDTPVAGFTLTESTGAYSFDTTHSAYDSLKAGQEATIVIPVTVTDPYGETATTNITINLVGTNDAPTVQAIQTRAFIEGDSVVTGDLNASDVDVDAALSYYTAANISGFTLDFQTGSYTFDASHSDYDYLTTGQVLNINIPIVITDEHGEEANTELQFTITGTNDAPTVTQNEAVDATEGGATVTGTISATDIDSDDSALTFTSTAIAGFEIDENTGAYSFDPTDEAYNYLKLGEETTVSIPVTVTDSEGQTATTNVIINLTGTNDTPTVQAVQTVSVNEGDSAISGNVNASDIDTDATLSYFTDEEVAGFTLDIITGDYTFDPSNSAYDYLKGGEEIKVTIPVTISDEHGLETETTLEFVVTGTNDAPTVTDISAVDTLEDAPVINGEIIATDVDGDDTQLTYTINPSVAGFTLSESTGSYSFDPTNEAYQSLSEGQTATVTIPVTVTEENGLTSIVNIVINLTGKNDIPTVNSIEQLSASTETITGTVIANDVDTGATLTYTNVQTAGFTLDSDTGVYSFDPTDEAYAYLAEDETSTLSIPVTVTDENGGLATTNISIIITGTNDGPKVLPSNEFEGTEIYSNFTSAMDVVADINAVDPDGVDMLSYALVANDSDASQYLTINEEGVVNFKDEAAFTEFTNSSEPLSFQVQVSDDSGLSTIYTIQNGVGIDGYIVNMTVFSDANNDGQLNNGEASDTTNELGEFTLDGNVSGNIVGYGGTDVSTGFAFEGIYKAPERFINS